MTHTLEYVYIEYSHIWHAWMMYYEHEQELTLALSIDTTSVQL